MCQSVAEGGKRCAAHTRPRYEALMEAMETSGKGMTRSDRRKDARRGFEMDSENALNVVINYASTPSGKTHIKRDIESFKGQHDVNTVSFLSNALKRGGDRAEAAKEANVVVRKERAKREGHRGGGAGTGSVEKLKPSVGTTSENNCLAVYPQIAKLWLAEDNDGVGPEQCRPGSNGQLNWRCAECGNLVDRHNFRVNSLTASLKAGRVPVCDDCDPRRKEKFEKTQENLQDLVDVLGKDPKAFDTLPAALQYNILSKLGLMAGGEDSMNRNVAMSMVHGDLTLKDVVLAADVTKIDALLKEHGGEDTELGVVSDVMVDSNGADETGNVNLDQVLDSTGVLGLIDENTDLAKDIRRSTRESLWNAAYTFKGSSEEFSAYLDSRGGKSVYADQALDAFRKEYESVVTKPLPDGYQNVRTTVDGETRVVEPNLSQKRFAALVNQKRRFMNWSGTGAGKTLALQTAGARESIVVCPKPVIDQWKAEFESGFPGKVDVRVGLPREGENLEPLPEGTQRIWVTNYDQFQGDIDQLKKRINPLADRVDAIVYDEIHMVKSSDESSTSRRRTALQNFTDRAGRSNPDLIVVGASATPVVNDLSEAKSLLRIVEGPGSRSFPTAPTMKNAATAYSRISEVGVRHMPTYPTTLTRNDETVDVTGNVHMIQARINNYKIQSGSKTTNPAMIERALLPEKIPAIVRKAKAHQATKTGPSVIYTEYTTGMVEPIKEALEKEGLRVGTFTGNESDSERKNTLKAFKAGKYDTLIGSRPIATGVDGLQDVSNKLIVASMPWTAAQDDQLAGRLQRIRQQNNVSVDYILTEAKVGNTRWSWCKDNRQKRIRFKRDMANAAVDGVLPEGTFGSTQDGAEKSLNALKNIAALTVASKAA